MQKLSAACLWHDATVLGSQIVGSRGCAILRGLCPFLPVLRASCPGASERRPYQTEDP